MKRKEIPPAPMKLPGIDIMNTEELLELMKNRRSIREFRKEPLEGPKLEHILTAATLSPSGADRLPFTIIKVIDDDMKVSIREGAENSEKEYHKKTEPGLKKWFDAKGIDHQKPFLTQAPALLVIAADTTKPYWRESAWLSIGYILLAIEAEGLGTVTYTPSETKFLNELLGIPEHFSPEVILPIGYPVEILAPKKTRVKGRVFDGKYGD